MKTKTIDKRYIMCGSVNKSESGKNLVGYFRNKPLWLFMKNKWYEENMKLEFPNDHYDHKTQVPKFTIFKKGKKAFNFFPREKETGEKFLFGTLKNKKYYIWEIDEEYNIEKSATIYFDIKSDFF